ncbi:hypothetical protein [Massilia sp. DWR3-1-1]|uniref:hypothetical protein n=1 Tax=Massilia sp. DWR3-1-1 TaxID=2804559 RepID=UPI003CF3697E
MGRRLAACLAAVGALASGAGAADLPPGLCLRGPAQPQVAFHGLPNFDGAGGSATPILYPAPNLAGMLGGVIAHGLLVNGGREREKERIREEADKVLLPYHGDLAQFNHEQLLGAALAQARVAGAKRLAAAATVAGVDETVLDSAPLFYMTQDRRALVLVNTLTVRIAGAAAAVQKMVRVVSAPRARDAEADWTDGTPNLLRRTSIGMQARAIEIALADANADYRAGAAAPFRTVRYDEGGVERMERAQVVAEQCGELVIRTLRGELMAVPRKAAGGDPLCTPHAGS